MPSNEFLYGYSGLTESSEPSEFWTSDDCQNLPDSKNWMKEGKVSPVQSQYPCGSSYLFAAVAALESATAIFYETSPRKLSAQHTLECVKNTTGGQFKGCDGGRPEWVWKYASEQGGLVAESSYAAYEGNPDNKCFPNLAKDSNSAVLKWQKIEKGNEEALKCRVAKHGPVVVGISLNGTSLKRFFTGIFDDPEDACTPGNPISHAMLVVGYGSEFNREGNLVDYWLIVNSWSTLWGNKGTFKMLRGKNTCKIAEDAMFPVIKPKPINSGGESEVLKPVAAPNVCEGQGTVLESEVYKKSFCVIEFLQTHENSQVSCAKHGMQLYQVNSPVDRETIINFLNLNRKSISLYVDGKNISGCLFVDSFSETPTIVQGDCEQQIYSVCEFFDIDGKFYSFLFKIIDDDFHDFETVSKHFAFKV